MESRSLQINGKAWIVSVLAEQALVLEPVLKEVPISLIHQVTRMLEKAELPGVADFIPAYQNIALVYDRLLEDLDTEIQEIEERVSDDHSFSLSPKKHEVLVCYELGLDWKEVEDQTGLSRDEIIKKHLKPEYNVAMMGFVPGFVYLTGLDERIACPRKENPRTTIPPGAVGIGGNQTGIYSVESPGGWQIIGRTPQSFFEVQKIPPTQIQPGDELIFSRISKAEFKELENKRVE